LGNAIGYIGALGIAHALAATAVVAAVGIVGGLVFGSGRPAAAVPVAALIAALVLADVSVRSRSRLSLRRQTPQDAYGVRSPMLGAAIWGLETGIIGSTYRMTTASWSVLVLAATGWAHPLTGAAYAGGFLVPLAIAIFRDGAQCDARTTDADPTYAGIMRLRRPSHAICFALGTTICTVLVVTG